MNSTGLDQIRWTEDGLVPVIAQESSSREVLMFAWMNREALELTLREGFAVYWSRSRQRLWRKGEVSGHRQRILEIRIDCDQDVILLEVEQIGGIACHTGRHRCFFRKFQDDEWICDEAVLKDPANIYGPGS